MVLVAEDEVQREHAGLRRYAGCVCGCRDDEVDVTRAQLLQRLRLGPQLRAGELIDAELAATQRLQLFVEYVGSDAVGRRHRLVVGEAELALRRGIARQPQRQEARGKGHESKLSHGEFHRVSLPGRTRTGCWACIGPTHARRSAARRQGDEAQRAGITTWNRSGRSWVIRGSRRRESTRMPPAA